MIEHIAVRLRAVVDEHADRVATRIRVANTWVTQTFREFGLKVDRNAQAFIDAGLEPGDRIGLFANNCPEWSEIDFGAATARVVPVPIYATSTPQQIRHIAQDSGLKIMFVGGRSEAERVLAVRDELPEMSTIVTLKRWPDMPKDIVYYRDFLAEPNHQQIDERLAGASGEDLVSIIYTSGTTGDPKGVMLQHKAMIAQKDALDQFFDFTPDQHSLCFLPLSHALERGWTCVILLHGCMNTYVSNARTVAEQMVLAKPTMLVSVPKLYETVYATARNRVAKSAVKKAIFEWALRVGGQNQRAYRKGKTPNLYWRVQLPFADRLVLRSIRQAMGGPKLVMACGGAPIRLEVEEFFSAAGMQLFTGYGLTEASPLVSFSSRSSFKLGTSGRVIPGGEVRIGELGEILYRGPNVMKGYWNQPEATAEALVDGWLHTGDAGYVDTDGFLMVTDRIKDIIVTLGGKNVAPQPIEGLILADPLFEHAVLLGDNRPYLTLLVKPSLPQLEELGRIKQWPGEVADWLKSQELLEEIKARIAKLTEMLPSQERPRETAVMEDELTMDNGLLTPTLKVRRRQVEERFKSLVEDMYSRLEKAYQERVHRDDAS